MMDDVSVGEYVPNEEFERGKEEQNRFPEE